VTGLTPGGPAEVWVLDEDAGPGTLERLGDARHVADRLRGRVGVLAVGPADPARGALVPRGADRVVHLVVAEPTAAAKVAAGAAWLAPRGPRLVLAAGDVAGREWAARLAARTGWRLVSPALGVEVKGRELEVLALGAEGFCRRVRAGEGEPVVATLRPGVGEALPADPGRTGEVTIARVEPEPDGVVRRRHLPSDPETVDIRFASRLVAGGRGLGGREGFDLLRRFARRIGAGVAASRMAVDLGWIERERQVGQTGRTVRPHLYLACGISGASHHLEGMSEARHVVAINTDPRAPIFRAAHLGLVGDLHAVLGAALAELERAR
jgi:electron transfer flavoprotein alpha subunit